MLFIQQNNLSWTKTLKLYPDLDHTVKNSANFVKGIDLVPNQLMKSRTVSVMGCLGEGVLDGDDGGVDPEQQVGGARVSTAIRSSQFLKIIMHRGVRICV
jgi:hypothetical protein